MQVLRPDALERLFDALVRRGFTVVGPTVRNRAIVYERLESPNDLPVGWTDEQDGGSYRLKKRNDGSYFGYVVGPQTWKKFLFPPEQRLWTAARSGNGFTVVEEPHPTTQYAFIGARACEIHAIDVLDRVLLGGDHVDDVYRAFREGAFVVAVNCTQPGGTCFCVSMDSGPRATRGYDLSLTEIVDGDAHYFAAEAGTKRGEEVLGELPGHDAADGEKEAADKAVAKAASQMGRAMDTDGLKELLYDNYEHPRWDDVANRCLTCGNCTMVCPTCFCTNIEDTNDLSGDHAERWRRWDSCFTYDFTYIHGGQLRRSAMARYRQWMTHKLAAWQDQFDMLGCVGCGRCITWCPVGIDITEEVLAIRKNGGD